MDLRNRILVFLRSRFLRIFIIGGIGFVVQTIVFEVVGVFLGLVSLSTAAVLGGELGVLTNFVLNERFSFSDRVSQSASRALRLLRFHGVVAGSLFIQWLSVFTAEQYTEDIVLLHLAYVSGVIVGFVSNYIGYHLIVWKKSQA
jgi:putative flippase GtrA